MSIKTLFAVLVGLAIMAIAFTLITSPAPEQPINGNVHDQNYTRIEQGMTLSQVQDVLGQPHLVCAGEVVKVEKPDSIELSCTIEPADRDPTGNGHLVHIYKGPDDESIRVLFSGNDRRVVAAEYCIGDKSVLYKGVSSVKNRSDVMIAPRLISLTPEQDERIKRFQRRQILTAQATANGGASQVPPPSAPGASPVPAASSTSLAKEAQTTSASRAPTGATSDGIASPKTGQPATDSSAKPTSSDPSGAAGRPVDPGAPATPQTTSIKLPSGAELSETALDLPSNWQISMFPPGVTVYVAKYPNDAPQGVFVLDKGKLHGPAVRFFPDGKLQTLAGYLAGELKGPLRLWDEQQRRILYAEFKRDKRNGLLCFFREGKPWLIQEWSMDAIQDEYLVKYSAGTATVVPGAKAQGKDAEDFTAAKEKLDELEKQLWENEAQLKRGLAKWYRAESERIRRERFASQAPVRRDNAQRRDLARQAQQAAEAEAFWRTVLMRSWR